jgi:hypothetical protein
MSRLTDDAAARPLLEIILGFAGALLVIPLIFRVLGGMMRTGLFRRLLTEAVLVGGATLLTRDDVVQKLFGSGGGNGSGNEVSQAKRAAAKR